MENRNENVKTLAFGTGTFLLGYFLRRKPEVRPFLIDLSNLQVVTEGAQVRVSVTAMNLDMQEDEFLISCHIGNSLEQQEVLLPPGVEVPVEFFLNEPAMPYRVSVFVAGVSAEVGFVG